MKIKSQQLIDELKAITQQLLSDAESLKAKDLSELQQQPESDKWNALMCLEHLNRYGDFYLPEIKSRLAYSTHEADEYFKGGLLGNYFAESMKPKEKLNKMNTFKSMNPIDDTLDKDTIDTFIAQQKEMLNLLDDARDKSLKKTKTAISISKWIKLRLGDTFRIVIYHNQRHMVQAFNAINQLKQHA
ncbi:DinB family protein [Fulvivirga sp. RKSG066]|uniref:DinB family protein n=1 Tax=Fulvivirga aurantia TaxID=2529383 RepID=UPI0012BC8AFE|nr:DinB family protein [Fulvivirga aurantia]MTI21539.1 DinB family protein [Fulvivirga aurantia]